MPSDQWGEAPLGPRRARSCSSGRAATTPSAAKSQSVAIHPRVAPAPRRRRARRRRRRCEHGEAAKAGGVALAPEEDERHGAAHDAGEPLPDPEERGEEDARRPGPAGPRTSPATDSGRPGRDSRDGQRVEAGEEKRVDQANPTCAGPTSIATSVARSPRPAAARTGTMCTPKAEMRAPDSAKLSATARKARAYPFGRKRGRLGRGRSGAARGVRRRLLPGEPEVQAEAERRMKAGEDEVGRAPADHVAERVGQRPEHRGGESRRSASGGVIARRAPVRRGVGRGRRRRRRRGRRRPRSRSG
jgi:hypothetical protein